MKHKSTFIKSHEGYSIYSEYCNDQNHIYSVYDDKENFMFYSSTIEEAEGNIEKLIYN